MTVEPVAETASDHAVTRTPLQVGRILCGLVLALMAVALAYTGWIASSNFASIHV